MAARAVDQLLQGRLDERLLVGDEARLVAPRGRGDRRREPGLERRDALVLVDAGGGAVAHGNQAYDQLFFHKTSKTSSSTAMVRRAPLARHTMPFSHA